MEELLNGRKKTRELCEEEKKQKEEEEEKE